MSCEQGNGGDNVAMHWRRAELIRPRMVMEDGQLKHQLGPKDHSALHHTRGVVNPAPVKVDPEPLPVQAEQVIYSSLAAAD